MRYVGFIPIDQLQAEGYPSGVLDHIRWNKGSGFVIDYADVTHLLLLDNFEGLVYVFELGLEERLPAINSKQPDIWRYLTEYFANVNVITELAMELQLIIADRLIRLLDDDERDQYKEFIDYVLAIIKEEAWQEFQPIIQTLLEDFGLGIVISNPGFLRVGWIVPQPELSSLSILVVPAAHFGFDQHNNDIDPYALEYEDMSADLALEMAEFVMKNTHGSDLGNLIQARFLINDQLEYAQLIFAFGTEGNLGMAAMNQLRSLNLKTIEQLREEAADFNRPLDDPFARWADEYLD